MSDATGDATLLSSGDTVGADDRPLDDVLLAMDVVDTLRHREQVVATELDAVGREAALIKRLREIYDAQGIDVPDHVLREGVKALEERRFLYTPPKPSLPVSLAKVYIARDRWLKPVAVALTTLVIALGGYQFGIAGPSKAREAAAIVALEETLPTELRQTHERVVDLAEGEDALRLADAYLTAGREAIADKDVRGAERSISDLQALGSELSSAYDVTIVSRPGEDSGFFRENGNVRNFYLVVEAKDATGRVLPVTLTSEENQKVARVEKWAQRVTEARFNAAVADKQDDQIIQDAILGTKAIGELTPAYTDGVQPGIIFEW